MRHNLCPASAAERTYSKLKWGPCASPPGQPLPPALQCATVKVPLDYGKRHSPMISIGISRLKTSKPGVRRGVILANAGEPGRPGLYLPLQLSGELSPAVLDRYDLIGFDPRGVGQSSPVSCGLRPGLLNVSDIYPYPEGDGSIQANIAYSQEVAKACARNEPRMLRHLTTKNIARDMDRIRAALREPRISYLGFSSGSYLGSTFGELFPTRTDRIVLDSGGHPDRMWRGIFQNWAPATKLRFPDFTTWLAGQDATYHLGKNPAELEKLYLKLAAGLDVRPIRLPARPLVQRVAGRQHAARGDPAGHVRRRVLPGDRGALAGRPGPVAGAGPHRADRAVLPGGDADRPGGAHGFGVVRDGLRRRAVAAVGAAVRGRGAGRPGRAPGHGRHAEERGVVRVLALHPDRQAGQHHRRGAKNVLMLNNTHDPASPYEGAVALRKAFGDRARLVTVDGGGHGTLFHFMSRATPNACADRYVDEFLLHGRRPAADAVCNSE